MLDTGAQANYLGEEITEKCGLSKVTITEINAELANKAQVQINSEADFDLKFQQVPHTKFTMTARVLSASSFDLIIGKGFLRKNKFVFNYENNFIKLIIKR